MAFWNRLNNFDNINGNDYTKEYVKKQKCFLLYQQRKQC